MGFLLDALVTLFLLLALRLCMIVVYDLIKLKQSRRANSRQVLVYGHGDKSCLWSRASSKLAALPRRRFLTYGSPAQAYDRGVPGLLFRESAQRRIPAGPSRCRRDPFRHQ